MGNANQKLGQYLCNSLEIFITKLTLIVSLLASLVHGDFINGKYKQVTKSWAID